MINKNNWITSNITKIIIRSRYCTDHDYRLAFSKNGIDTSVCVKCNHIIEDDNDDILCK